MNALILVIISSLSFVIGYFITKLFKDKSKLNNASIAMAFTVLIGLLITDLIPHLGHHFEGITIGLKIMNIVIYVITGLGLLKILDMLMPSHHHNHKEHDDNIEEHTHNLEHIGLITTLSILLHNFLESIAMYNIGLESIKAGALMALAVSLHNIPLSIGISTSIESKNKKYKFGIISLLILSTIIGPILFHLDILKSNEYLSGMLIAITIGMVLYLIVFEFFKQVKTNIKKRETIIGILIGLAIILLIQII